MFALAQSNNDPHNRPMTEKEIVLETIRELPDDCSLEEIAERIEFSGRSTERPRSTRPRRRYSSRRSKKTAGLMAYKLIWSAAARDDLHDIVVFIARDNPNRAMSFGYELISETDRVHEFPEFGRIVPEYRSDYIREIVFRPYRIVYRVDQEQKMP